MVKPSIRGAVFKGVVDDLLRARDAGRVSDTEIEAEIAPEHVILLKGEIDVTAWYPLECYEPIVRLLCNVDGAGRDSYFVERGRASAKRLMESGMYQQLDFLARWGETLNPNMTNKAMIIADYASKFRMVMSMASITCNVGKWLVEPDPDNAERLRVAIREARDFPETMRLAAEGFINECSRIAREEQAQLFVSERAGPDLILFRMTVDMKDLWTASRKDGAQRRVQA